MDQIAEQLKEEIKSLQQYIGHTEKRLLATNWVETMLDPLEQIEDEFAEEEIKEVVEALFTARKKFSVNGHLAGRMDDFLNRYKHLIPIDDESNSNIEGLPAKDPLFSPMAIPSYADDEEHIAIDDLIAPHAVQSGSILPEDRIDDIETVVSSTDERDTPADTQRENTLGENASSQPLYEQRDNTLIEQHRPAKEDSVPLSETRDLLNQDPDGLFAASGNDSDATIDKNSENKGTSPASPTQDVAAKTAQPSGNPDDLFAATSSDSQLPKEKQPDKRKGSVATTKATNPAKTELPNTNPDKLFDAQDSKPDKTQDAKRRNTTAQPASKIRQKNTENTDKVATATYDIFHQRIDLDDLLLDLGVDIPDQDKIQLKHLRKQKLESRTVAALQSYEPAAGQYVLIPRITRFIHNGTVYPCTVKNLARTFISLFADIKDLMQYKALPFLDGETPELGWSIVPIESPRETLDKNYIEQAQFLRFIATTTGVPSHLVRRRTLVESVYDIIVSRMTLDSPMQSKTLDWTSTGPGKSDFICVFHSEQGLRLRHLNRTQRNKALGLCPNW